MPELIILALPRHSSFFDKTAYCPAVMALLEFLRCIIKPCSVWHTSQGFHV